MSSWSSMLMFLFMGLARGVDPEPGVSDPFTPAAVTPDMFEELLHNSPFTRSLHQPGSIVLTGFFCVNGRTVILAKETGTDVTHLITDTPNERGWKLLELNRNADISHMTAKIAVEGGESMEIRYDESSLHPHAGAADIEVPTGIDTRPLPTDEERRKFVESITPRLNAMSEEQKKRFGKIFGEKLKGNPKLSDRQKGALLLKVLDHVAPIPE